MVSSSSSFFNLWILFSFILWRLYLYMHICSPFSVFPKMYIIAMCIFLSWSNEFVPGQLPECTVTVEFRIYTHVYGGPDSNYLCVHALEIIVRIILIAYIGGFRWKFFSQSFSNFVENKMCTKNWGVFKGRPKLRASLSTFFLYIKHFFTSNLLGMVLYNSMWSVGKYWAWIVSLT